MEEVVSRTYLVKERPDAILNIVDGSNLERNLYLTTQLMELGIPVLMAVNMMDVTRANGDILYTEVLAKSIGCPVVEISARTGEGIKTLVQKAAQMVQAKVPAEPIHTFAGPVEHALAHIEEATQGALPQSQSRWYSIKLFERDANVLDALKLSPELISHIEDDIISVERKWMMTRKASLPTNATTMFQKSSKMLRQKDKHRLTVSDKIDRIVTNRFLALPILPSSCSLSTISVSRPSEQKQRTGSMIPFWRMGHSRCPRAHGFLGSGGMAGRPRR